MSPIVLRTAARYLVPLLLLLSLFLLWRGHNEPGGGFVGGLVVAAAFVLRALAEGAASARQALRVGPRTLIGAGLLVMAAAGTAGLLRGEPFLTGLWLGGHPGGLALGTPLLFDVGVYLVVAGVSLVILLELAEAP